MRGEPKLIIDFNTFDEAMNLHQRMFEIFNKDHIITYADVFYLLKGSYNECPYECYKCGWTTLMDSKVRPCDDGRKWAVILSEPVNLTSDDNNKAKAITSITNGMQSLAYKEVNQGMRDLRKALLYLVKEEKENE